MAGAGPAGMQAALALDKHGFRVSLYEKEKQLGGLLNLASLPPHKQQLARLRDYLKRQLEKSGVNVLLEHPYDLKTLADEYPDYLVIAAGSRPLRPEIKGWDESFCLPFEHVLTGNIPIEESHVLVVGGGSNGCEMADFLLVGRNRISIVERMPYLAPDMEKKSRRDLINRLEKAQANIYTSAEIIEINSGKVIIRNKQGEMKEIEVDYVIAAVGYASNNPLYEAAQKVHHAVYLIGDSMQVGSIREAIAQGEMLARALTEFNY
ncbi:NAD(P)/FAD-dependent oxidoreductase [Syntrophomonas palmitatica]|uniref:NAD(P)/FAD-dependent oxidoreductase n=1 Tax=Syntrophomonas palmitatica TaxID=402877 RepID=UPI00241D3015|nr:NAD(P)/FAD-dependent oxidoreductase [Syntrophomonas palmitatica]